ncbi:hypothetical protein RRG08_044273 [Elysia crispata]|uniref:Uncharacterized protein n=1 Tax=Elysia crispata TaxID=231223 RepID=A0AAE0XXK7_9GAST|nr:hypothetical protein RRG08_044273 [Elysia crispata]
MYFQNCKINESLLQEDSSIHLKHRQETRPVRAASTPNTRGLECSPQTPTGITASSGRINPKHKRTRESRPVRAASTPNTRGLECSPQTPTGITASSGRINPKHKRTRESRPVRAASTPNTRGLECSPQTPTGITASSGSINPKHKRTRETRPVRAASTPNTRGLEYSPQTPTGNTASSGRINPKHKRTRVFTSNTDRKHDQFGPHQPKHKRTRVFTSNTDRNHGQFGPHQPQTQETSNGAVRHSLKRPLRFSLEKLRVRKRDEFISLSHLAHRSRVHQEKVTTFTRHEISMFRLIAGQLPSQFYDVQNWHFCHCLVHVIQSVYKMNKSVFHRRGVKQVSGKLISRGESPPRTAVSRHTHTWSFLEATVGQWYMVEFLAAGGRRRKQKTVENRKV